MRVKSENRLGLGDRVRALRGRMSQAAFARHCGIDKATLLRIERGTNENPSQLTLEKLAKGGSTSVGALLDPSARLVVGGARIEVFLPDDLKRLVQDLEGQLKETMEIARDALAVGRDLRARVELLEGRSRRRGRRTV
jgi:transcriptional regulator with XRE-family HTH domain